MRNLPRRNSYVKPIARATIVVYALRSDDPAARLISGGDAFVSDRPDALNGITSTRFYTMDEAHSFMLEESADPTVCDIQHLLDEFIGEISAFDFHAILDAISDAERKAGWLDLSEENKKTVEPVARSIGRAPPVRALPRRNCTTPASQPDDSSHQQYPNHERKDSVFANRLFLLTSARGRAPPPRRLELLDASE